MGAVGAGVGANAEKVASWILGKNSLSLRNPSARSNLDLPGTLHRTKPLEMCRGGAGRRGEVRCPARGGGRGGERWRGTKKESERESTSYFFFRMKKIHFFSFGDELSPYSADSENSCFPRERRQREKEREETRTKKTQPPPPLFSFSPACAPGEREKSLQSFFPSTKKESAPNAVEKASCLSVLSKQNNGIPYHRHHHNNQRGKADRSKKMLLLKWGESFFFEGRRFFFFSPSAQESLEKKPGEDGKKREFHFRVQA